MNVIQMHERVKFNIDHVRSPRFQPETLNEALNAATLELVNNRYNAIKEAWIKKGKAYAFQTIQRVRDELYTIVKERPSIIATGNVLLPIANFPADYKYLLQLWANINRTEYRCMPTSYDENLDYDFKRPQISEPDRVYYIEGNTGIRILFGDTGTLNAGSMWYLAEPAVINHGLVRTAPYAFLLAGTAICKTSTCVVNGVTYTIGDEITVAPAQNLTAGQVVEGFTNSDLPTTSHDEICIRAGRKLMGTADDYNKMKFEEIEEKKA